MSNHPQKPYGDHISIQGQYWLTSRQSERDLWRAPHHPGSSFSSLEVSSAASSSSGGTIPPMSSRPESYRPEQSGIMTSANFHTGVAREREGHQPVGQDVYKSSTQRDKFLSSGKDGTSHPASSTFQRHGLSDEDKSSLDWLSIFKTPIREYSTIPGLGDDDPESDNATSPNESQHPKFNPELAVNILQKLGIGKEDLEHLLSYREDQITYDNLPLILRQIRLQKEKRASTKDQSKSASELQPTQRSILKSRKVSDYGGTGKYTLGGGETGGTTRVDSGGNEIQSELGTHHTGSFQTETTSPNESHPPKFTPKLAVNILQKLGVGKEDLEHLLSYHEDQITYDNLPLILRQIHLRKEKRASTKDHSKSASELQPTPRSILKPSKVSDYGGTGKYTLGGDETGRTKQVNTGGIESLSQLGTHRTGSFQKETTSPNKSHPPKFTPELAVNILQKFGLGKEDLKYLLSYREDQITFDNLPLILRQIRLQKEKRVSTTDQSKSVSELQPTTSSILKPSKVSDYGSTGKYTLGGDETGGTTRVDSGGSGSKSELGTQRAGSSWKEPQAKRAPEVKNSSSHSSHDQMGSVSGLSSAQRSVAPPRSDPVKQQQTQPKQACENIFTPFSQVKENKNIGCLQTEAVQFFTLNETEPDCRLRLQTKPSSYEAHEEKSSSDQSKSKSHNPEVAELMKDEQPPRSQLKETPQRHEEEKSRQNKEEEKPKQLKEKSEQMSPHQKAQEGSELQPLAFPMGQAFQPHFYPTPYPVPPPYFFPRFVPPPASPQFTPGLARYPQPLPRGQFPAQGPVYSGPTQEMMNDYSSTPPVMFPHVCSLCSIVCATMRDWLPHQNSSCHLKNCQLLRKRFPSWDGHTNYFLSTPGKNVEPSPSTSAQSWLHGHQKTQHERRSRSRSPRRRHRSRSSSGSISSSYSPKRDRTRSRSRSRSSSRHRTSKSKRSRSRSRSKHNSRRSRSRSSPHRSRSRNHDRRSPSTKTHEKHSTPRTSLERSSVSERSTNQRRWSSSGERQLETSESETVSSDSAKQGTAAASMPTPLQVRRKWILEYSEDPETSLTVGEMVETYLKIGALTSYQSEEKYFDRGCDGRLVLISNLPKYYDGLYNEENVANLLQPFGFEQEEGLIYIIPQVCLAIALMSTEKSLSQRRGKCWSYVDFKCGALRIRRLSIDIAMTWFEFYQSLMNLMGFKVANDHGARTVYIEGISTEETKELRETLRDVVPVKNFLPLLNKLYVEFETTKDADQLGILYSCYKKHYEHKVHRLCVPEAPTYNPEGICPISLGSPPPFWIPIKARPYVFPILSPWWSNPTCLTVNTLEDLHKAGMNGAYDIHTVMLTGFQNGEYTQRDVVLLVWPSPIENFLSLEKNVVILPLQKRAFVYFSDWSSCYDFVRKHISERVSLKGTPLHVHLILKEMDLMVSEFGFYQFMMKQMCLVVTEDGSRIVYIKGISLEEAKELREVLSDIVPVRNVLPLLNKLYVEFETAEDADHIGVLYSYYKKHYAHKVHRLCVPEAPKYSPEGKCPISLGSPPPFWIPIKASPYMFPTLSPWWSNPTYLTANTLEDLVKAKVKGARKFHTVMLTGFQDGEYTHRDVVELVWPSLTKENFPLFEKNVVVLPLQKRAFVYFGDWSLCRVFIKKHIAERVSLKGTPLHVHFVLEEMNLIGSEVTVYKNLMKLSNLDISDPATLESRMLSIETSVTSVDLIMKIVQTVASVEPVVNYLPFANKIYVEMSSSSSVRRVLENCTFFYLPPELRWRVGRTQQLIGLQSSLEPQTMPVHLEQVEASLKKSENDESFTAGGNEVQEDDQKLSEDVDQIGESGQNMDEGTRCPVECTEMEDHVIHSDSHVVEDDVLTLKQKSDEDATPVVSSDKPAEDAADANDQSPPEIRDDRGTIVQEEEKKDSEESSNISEDVGQISKDKKTLEDGNGKDVSKVLTEQEDLEILDSVNDQIVTADDSLKPETDQIAEADVGSTEDEDAHQVTDSVETESAAVNKEEGTKKDDVTPEEVIRPTQRSGLRSRTSKSEEESSKKQDRTVKHETHTKDITGKDKETDEDTKETDSVQDKSGPEISTTKRSGRRRSTRGTKDQTVSPTSDSVEDEAAADEATVTTRSTRGRRQKQKDAETEKSGQDETPTRRRNTAVAERDEEAEDKVAKHKHDDGTVSSKRRRVCVGAEPKRLRSQSRVTNNLKLQPSDHDSSLETSAGALTETFRNISTKFSRLWMSECRTTE